MALAGPPFARRERGGRLWPGVRAGEGVAAKRVGKEPNWRPLLRTAAIATAGKMGAKWAFSPAVAADAFLPPGLLAPSLFLQHGLDERDCQRAARAQRVAVELFEQLRERAEVA